MYGDVHMGVYIYQYISLEGEEKTGNRNCLEEGEQWTLDQNESREETFFSLYAFGPIFIFTKFFLPSNPSLLKIAEIHWQVACEN